MKRTFATLVATGITVGIGLFAPQVSSATPELVLGTCPTGTSTITYEPGVTDEPTTVMQTGKEESGTCTFVSPLGVRSFTAEFTGELITSCTELLTGSDSGTQTFHWNDGLQSYWEFTSVTSQTAEGNVVAVYSGKLTRDSSFLPGAAVTQVVTYSNLTVESCQAEPMTEQSGTSTYVFSLL
jgi:hypothetical protein